MKKAFLLILILLLTLMVIPSPVYAVGDIVGPDVIYKDMNEIISITDITSLYAAADATVYASEDNFTGFGHIVGDKHITLTATDGLIEKSKEIIVKVTDDKIPDVTIDGITSNIFKLVGKSSAGYTFVTLQDKTITLEIMRDTLINLDELTIVEPSSRNILLDTYTENKTTPGTYTFNFRILDATGVIKTFNTQIKVLQISEDWEPLEPTSPIDFFEGWDFNIVGTIFSWIVAIGVIVGIAIGLRMIYTKLNKKNKKGKGG